MFTPGNVRQSLLSLNDGQYRDADRITEVGTVHRGTRIALIAVIFALTGCTRVEAGFTAFLHAVSSIEAKTSTLSDPTSGFPALPLVRAGFFERASGYN